MSNTMAMGERVSMKATMQAVAVCPGKANTLRLEMLPVPALDSIPDEHGVLVRVLRVGVDGTDREIAAGEYGVAPAGDDFLVLGHESFGVVEKVGASVTRVAPGDFVVATVRRPGMSVYDKIGFPDFTTDDAYYEHGISRVHGFLTEYYVDAEEFLVQVPPGLREVGVLLEPVSVAEKGIQQAYEIQRRLRVWQPCRAAVLGSGPLGILATMILRLRGLEVVTFGLTPRPYLNSDLVEALGARYVSTNDMSLSSLAESEGRFDLIFEATGYSPIVFVAMQALAKNGVLVLSSVTGGDRRVEVPADRLNLEFVLGNKVMVGTVNASRGAFEAGVSDFAQAEAQWPGWLGRLITHRVTGLAHYEELFAKLGAPGVIKVVCEVAP